MSRENLEVALGLVDAVARMDGDRLVELTHPTIEWHSILAQVGEGGVDRGHDGIREEHVRDLAEAWDVFHAEVEDSLVVGDLVLLVSRLRFRGTGSGVDTDSPAGHLVKFRDGRASYMWSFQNPERVIEALGRSE